jgi:MFS family permease
MIRADLYKVFRRPLFYILLASMAVLAFLVNFCILKLSTTHLVYNSWTAVMLYFLSWPALLMPLMIDLVGAEKYKENTLKNDVSYGVSRTKLYLSQMTVSIVLGLIVGGVALGTYCGSSLLMLQQDAAFTSAFIADFFSKVGVCCIGYVACIALASFLSTMFQKNSFFVFAFFLAIYFPQLLFNLLQLSRLNQYLLIPQFGMIAIGDSQQLMTSAVVFVVTGVVFTVLGAAFFKKKDIC